MNINNLDNIEVPEEEIEELKRKLYKSKKKTLNNKGLKMVACLTLLFSIGFAFPAYTKDIPIYKNIFELFDSKNYQTASELINQSVTDKGITITIADAVYINNQIRLTYVLESEKPLEGNINFMERFSFENNSSSGQIGVGAHFKPIGNNKYIGTSNYNFTFKEENINPLKVNLAIDIIELFNNDYTSSKEIKGNWKFNFKLNQSPKKDYLIGENVTKDNVTLQLNKVTIDEAGTEFFIMSWNDLGVDPFSYTPYYSHLYNSKGEELKLEDLGGFSNSDIVNIGYRCSEKLALKENYKLSIELKKNSDNGVDEKGNAIKYNDKFKDNLKYEQNPENITIEIPFSIK